VREHKVLEHGLGCPALGLLSRGDDLGNPSRTHVLRHLCDGSLECLLERLEVERCEVAVGEKDIGRGREGGDYRLYEVRDEVEAEVDDLVVEDGDLLDVSRCVRLREP
jgi:hypothetical protein